MLCSPPGANGFNRSSHLESENDGSEGVRDKKEVTTALPVQVLFLLGGTSIIQSLT